MKRSLFLLSAVALAGAARAGAAQGQDSFDFRAADLGLLQARPIQNDMGVTQAQRDKLNAAAKAHQERLVAYEKTLKALGNAKPDQNRVQGLVLQLKREAFAALTPKQIRRLRELTLQRLGMVALTDNEVAQQVGLSMDQVSKLRSALVAGRQKFQTIQRETAGPIIAPYRNRKPKDQAQAVAWEKEVRAKLNAALVTVKPRLIAVGKATDAQMLAVLTPAQKAKWNALKGAPFKGK